MHFRDSFKNVQHVIKKKLLEMHVRDMGLDATKPILEVSDQVDPNRPTQLQRLARIAKFCLEQNLIQFLIISDYQRC